MSCSTDTQPLTQVMVVVDSSMAQITAVRVRVEGMGDPKVAMASDLSKHPLPRTVAVVHRGGPLGPIEITAEGLDGDEILVQRRAQLSFVRGRNLVLELELEQSCVDFKPQCDDDQTCIAGGCETAEVDARRLSDWNGKVPKHDDAGSGGDADSGIGKGGGESGVGGHSGNGGAGGLDMGGNGGSISGAGGSDGGTGGNTVTQACTGCSFDPGVTAHGSLTCDDGVCNLHCEEGYNDADQARGNGCEKADSAFPWKVSNIDPDDATLMAATTPSITIDCSGTLDLGTGAVPTTVEVCSQQLQPIVVGQPSGPELVVFVTQHLTVVSGAAFRFTGSRPIAFLVAGDAEIGGKLDVSAKGTAHGAGGGTECSPGLGGDGTNAEHGGGGGGGGFGTPGAMGAKSKSEDAAGGPGGGTSVDSLLIPLRGGCPGGKGGNNDGSAAAGGGAGGALQLSVSGRLLITGTLAAGGGGGDGGSDLGDGGGGGGSGGGLVLEATKIETSSTAWLTANGGGGGAGRMFNADPDAGDDGAHASSSVAEGGTSITSVLANTSRGGSGAAGSTSATTPPVCTASDCGGGGGGGGTGRIVLRSADCQLSGSASPFATCAAHL